MLKVTSQEFQRNLGKYQEHAHQESITITRHKRDYLVVMNVKEYEQLRKNARISMSTLDFTDEDIKSIETSSVSQKHDHLNDELV